MSVLWRERKARKSYVCEICGEPINPGEVYSIASLTPHDSDIGNEVWWTQRQHGRTPMSCPWECTDNSYSVKLTDGSGNE